MPLLPWLVVLGVIFAGNSLLHKTPTPTAVNLPAYEVPTPLIIPIPSVTETASTTEVPVAATTTKPKIIETVVPQRKPQPAPPAPVIPVPAKPETVPAPAEETVETTTNTDETSAMRAVRAALVNILCTTSNQTVRAMSGSGVIIDPHGIILTVAHVGQYFLLAEGEAPTATCVIRTGSPAKNAYFAKPIYVSESWIEDHPGILLEEHARGTGEHDFAILAITQSATKAPLPVTFPALSLSKETPQTGDGVIIGTYGAQFVSSEDIRTSLLPTLITDTVKDVYTFNRTTVDVLSLGGNAAAQSGSSGGAVADTDGKLVGLITTSTTDGPVASRDVRAITLRHIRESFSDDTRSTFDAFLSAANPEALATSFSGDMEILRSLIIKTLGL